jgi:hypothetical protein
MLVPPKFPVPSWLLALGLLPDPKIAAAYCKLALRGLRLVRKEAREAGKEHRRELTLNGILN